MRRTLNHNANCSGHSEPSITSSQILELKKDIKLAIKEARSIINQLRKSLEINDISEAEAIDYSEYLCMASEIMNKIYSIEKTLEMEIFSKYLERKMRKANVTYSYNKITNNLIMENKETGEKWIPLLQTDGKYKRGFWKPD